MRYLSVAETAKKMGYIGEKVFVIIVRMDVFRGRFLPERPGMYRKMQLSRCEQIRRRISRKTLLSILRKKRKVNIPVEFIIRHKLI